VAQMFQALSNPNRLRIFMRLVACCGVGGRWSCQQGHCPCVGELGQDLGIAPSTVSHHVKELHRAGLMRIERRGKRVDCWIEPDILARLARFFQQPGPACCSELAGSAPPPGRGARGRRHK
jgi:ArsR family transcriptional regulator